MIALINQKNSTRMMLLGECESDRKVLEVLFDNHICWGFYKLTIVDKEKAESQHIVKLLERFPNLTAIGHFSSPEGFVPSYHKTKEE